MATRSGGAEERRSGAASGHRWWLALLLALGLGADIRAAEPLRVVASVPELAELVAMVGGERVRVSACARPGDDPHRVEAIPSLITDLAKADLLVSTGLELEIGWLPPLIKASQNRAIRPSADLERFPHPPGFFEASSAVPEPLEKVTTPLDRSAGDVHPGGNPHFLLDPLIAVAVSAKLAERLSQLQPEGQADFVAQHRAFAHTVGEKLVGAELAAKYEPVKLAQLAEYGRLASFLSDQGDRAKLGGWLGELVEFAGSPVVMDHNQWPYLLRRYGLHSVGILEPKPGIPPSARHLAEVIATMGREQARVIVTSPFFDQRPVELVAGRTGAAIARLAHQPGSRPGTETYLAMCEWNVRQLAEALRQAAKQP